MSLLNDIHNIINFATDKGVTGYHRPEDIDNEIHAVSTDLWQKYYKQYARTKEISSYMAPFVIDPDTVTISSTTGKGKMAVEIEHPTLVMTSEEKEVAVRERFQWAKVINDPVSPPTKSYPSILFGKREYDDADEIWLYNVEARPKDLGTVLIYGLRKPKKPNWTYTIGTDGRRVFNPNDSDFQDIEWSELLHDDIRDRVLQVMGINLREGEVAQFYAQKSAVEGE